MTLLASAAASALFIAPNAYHRIMFGEGEKARLVRISSNLALSGLVFLAIAMNGAVLLVTDLLFEQTTVTITLVVLAALYIALWFGLGLARRLAGDRSHA